MKKTLALTLALALLLALGAPALAADDQLLDFPVSDADAAAGIMPISDLPEEVDVLDVPIPTQYVGAITVDGVELDLSGVPGAPVGYIPMRAFCEAAGTYVDWYAEDNEAFFMVDGLGVVVDLTDLTVKKDLEDVPGVRAYLDPAGYTFLPASFLTTFENVKLDDHPELSSVRFDFTTLPERSELEAVADAVVKAAQVGATIQLDAEAAADFGVSAENYEEIVVLFPMISANPSSVYVAQVKEGKMTEAKADLTALRDYLLQLYGNYRTCVEMIENGKLVEAGDGSHLMLLVAPEVDAGVAAFTAAFGG